MAKDYVKSETAKFVYADSSGAQRTMQLLWGDEVDVQGTIDGKATVKARGRLGVVDAAHLGGSPLLEVYFIDVGQGDGVLICTPERKHVLIDGGWIRSRQPTGKNAADFVDWKFHEDYGLERIHLDAMIASHCDADHYGGLWDLFSTSEEARKELDTEGTEVETVAAIRPDLLDRIGTIYFETTERPVLHAERFERSFACDTCRLVNRRPPASYRATTVSAP